METDLMLIYKALIFIIFELGIITGLLIRMGRR